MLEDQNEDAETQEFEEIHSDEVDRVVERLAELAETVESETITDFLEEASTKIYELIYEEEEGEDEEECFGDEYETDEDGEDDDAMAA